MSIERSTTVGSKLVNQVSLRCRGDSTPRFMIKPAELVAPWCAAEVNGLCNKNKYALARKICKYNSKGYKSLAKKSSGPTGNNIVKTSEGSAANKVVLAPQADAEQANDSQSLIADLRRELILIEEQRIQIEQRRLELVRREIALKKGVLPVSGAGD